MRELCLAIILENELFFSESASIMLSPFGHQTLMYFFKNLFAYDNKFFSTHSALIEHTLKGYSKIDRSDFFRHMHCLWQEIGILMQKRDKLPFLFLSFCQNQIHFL